MSFSSERLPVYFISIGGPNSIGNKDHPSNQKFIEWGTSITRRSDIKAIVVISAHWQAGPTSVQVNVQEDSDIIYDFHGFPSHFYQYKFPYKGSKTLGMSVIDILNKANIRALPAARGLDHGVWAGFISAFDPERNPLKVPIVQLSLFLSEDAEQHIRLGQALQSMRDQGILIVGTGMAVHNTADFRRTRGSGETLQYAVNFDQALKQAVTTNPQERQEAMLALLRRADLRDAHPSLEHLLPIYVCAGAAGLDKGQALWNFPEGSLSWSQYRFG